MSDQKCKHGKRNHSSKPADFKLDKAATLDAKPLKRKDIVNGVRITVKKKKPLSVDLIPAVSSKTTDKSTNKKSTQAKEEEFFETFYKLFPDKLQKNPDKDELECIKQARPDGKECYAIQIPCIKSESAKETDGKDKSNPELKSNEEYLKLNDSVQIQNKILENAENYWMSSPLIEPKPISTGENEIELTIGLDFGTTFCKVVLREVASGRAWAVPFSENLINPYLLCTTIWKRNKLFTLMRTNFSIRNLKIALFSSYSGLKEEIEAAAFIGLILMYVKAWFWKNKAIEYPNSDVFWAVHMGLPARNFQDAKLIQKFRKVLWSGMLLAEQFGEEIEEKFVDLCISAVSKAIQDKKDIASISNWGSVHKEQVDIFPEIAAQIYGYLKSDLRDPSQEIFMLVDVGGGTVDAAVFRVLESKKDLQPQFVFWGTAVKALGVYVLHRERLAWHIKQIHHIGTNTALAMQLQQALDENHIPNVVPGMIQEYLIGAEYPNVTCDNEFSRDFGIMLWNDIVMAARERVGDFYYGSQKIAFLLCGGGRSIALYNGFLKSVNSKDSATRLELHSIEMGKPANLEPRNISNVEYHRLSVAYGLSFNDIGTIITPDNLMLEEKSKNSDISDRLIRKEDI